MRKTLLAAILLCSGIWCPASGGISRLWNEYEAARRADRPAAQAAVLSQIEKKAIQGRLTWDLHRCLEAQVGLQSSIDWRLHDSISQKRKDVIAQYGDPVLTVANYSVLGLEDSREQLIKNNEKALREHSTRSFYSLLGEKQSKCIASDYEYAVWALMPKVSGMFTDMLLERHSAAAVALLEERDSLQSSFSRLARGAAAGSEKALEELYGKCRDFDARRLRFKGEDALLAACLDVDRMMASLLRKEMASGIEGDSLLVMFKNMPEGHISLHRGGIAVFKSTVVNTGGSVYTFDTVRVAVPPIDDGDYTVEFGGDGVPEGSMNFRKRTISAACIRTTEGYSIFAADRFTGEPLDSVTLSLQASAAEVRAVCGGFRQSGFVALPDTILKAIRSNGGRSSRITCSLRGNDGINRLSEPVAIMDIRLMGCRNHIDFFTDRKVCIPGDTVNFKVLLSGSDTSGSKKVLALRTLTLRLFDPQGGAADSLEVTTGEFGTAAGSFVIPSRALPGPWLITASDGQTEDAVSFSVENPALPTFEVEFDPQQWTPLPGEETVVSGTIRRFDGHSISSATASYRVTLQGKEIGSGQLSSDEEGRFSLSFTAPGGTAFAQTCTVTVKVADSTGETLEFTDRRSAGGKPDCHFEVLNAIPGEFEERCGSDYSPHFIIADSVAYISLKSSYRNTGIAYRLISDGDTLRSGRCLSGGQLRLNTAADGSRLFRFEAEAIDNPESSRSGCTILAADPRGTAPLPLTRHLFIPVEGNPPALLIASGHERMWVCMVIFDRKGDAIREEMFLLGESGRSSIRIPLPDGCIRQGGGVALIYFNGGDKVQWTHRFASSGSSAALPASFTNFPSLAQPGSTVRATILTEPGTEAAINVYDRAMDAISDGRYTTPYWSNAPGETPFVAGGFATLAASTRNAYLETAVNDGMALQARAAGSGAAHLRSDFKNVLLFIPQARADSKGEISFEIPVADKTSSFTVQAFVHDKEMRCSVIDSGMVVRLPVQISVNWPQFLYEGDTCLVRGRISNASTDDVTDSLRIELPGGSSSRTVTVGSGKQYDFECLAAVAGGAKDLGIRISYAGDAVYASIPVIPSSQTITEARSAILTDGADRDSLINSLAGGMVNVNPEEAQLREISIADMLRESLPRSIDASSPDAVSLSGALLSAYISSGMGLESGWNTGKARVLDRLLACRNADGGFGWMPQMPSNAIVTAVVLERLAACGQAPAEAAAAVNYLDSVFISRKGVGMPYSLSVGQYLYVRSLYPLVALYTSSAGDESLRGFRRQMKEFLTPATERGLSGRVLAKARRALTLKNLSCSNEGILLAQSLGIGTFTLGRLQKSAGKDILSLKEYAVEHAGGGIWFPNAVAPWMGLLEGELYAHTLLHKLLGDDRICLWMMVQKETQKWDDDPAFAEAASQVLSSSPGVLATKVLSLSAATTIPLYEIKPSGNGMTVEVTSADGDTLAVGDKITVRYTITSDENRSFVLIRAPHPSSLRPADRLSGIRWPSSAYRSVLPEAIEYRIELLKQGTTEFTEEFFVTARGTFNRAAVTAESLYAPHYRANDAPSRNIAIFAEPISKAK